MINQISEQTFLREISEILTRIHPDILSDPLPKDANCAQNYAYTAQFALEHRFRNTAIALPLVQYALRHAAELPDSRFGEEAQHLAYLNHCLFIAKMLIDMHPAITAVEQDIMLAAAICHVLPENIWIPDLEEALTQRCQLDPDVARIIRIIFWASNDSGAGQLSYYDRVQEDKLAMLIQMVDRGHLLELLYTFSRQTAQSYISETRTFFFRMSIYAKDHYPELIPPIEVLTDKIRCTLDVSEILLSRYAEREAEMIQEILDIQEDNANIRRNIAILRETDAT